MRSTNTFKGKSLPKHHCFISPDAEAHIPVQTTKTTTRRLVSRSLLAYSKESCDSLYDVNVSYTRSWSMTTWSDTMVARRC